MAAGGRVPDGAGKGLQMRLFFSALNGLTGLSLAARGGGGWFEITKTAQSGGWSVTAVRDVIFFFIFTFFLKGNIWLCTDVRYTFLPAAC